MRRSSHKATLEAVRKLINAVGGTCNVLHQVGRLRGSAGIPDLYAQFHDGRWCHPQSFWVEIKPSGAKLTAAQKAFKEREEGTYGRVLVGGLHEVMEYLGIDEGRR